MMWLQSLKTLMMVIHRSECGKCASYMYISLGVEIGFEDSTYNTSDVDGMVLVCAAIYKGTLERSVAVLMVTTRDNTGSTGMLTCTHLCCR